jgi:hypothetical protein
MGDKALRGNRLTAQGGGHIAGPARRAQESGFYSPDMGMQGRFGYKHGMSAGKKAIKKALKPKGVFKPKGFKGSDEVRALLKGVRPNKRRTFKTHGKDVPTMAAEGGRAGYVIGGAAIKGATKLYKKYKKKKVYPETEKLTHQKGPYVGDVGSERKGPKKKGWEKPRGQQRPEPKRPEWKKPDRKRPDWKRPDWKQRSPRKVPDIVKEHFAKGEKEFAEGGKADKKWIQKATKGMVKTKPCTGKKFGSKSCPPGSRRYNLAKTFKKMGRERKAEG